MTDTIYTTQTEAPKEGWSWKKFFSGFFDGKNTAKAIVMAFHIAIVGLIVFSIYWFAKDFFKSDPVPNQPEVQNISAKEVDNSSNKKTNNALVSLCLFNCR